MRKVSLAPYLIAFCILKILMNRDEISSLLILKNGDEDGMNPLSIYFSLYFLHHEMTRISKIHANSLQLLHNGTSWESISHVEILFLWTGFKFRPIISGCFHWTVPHHKISWSAGVFLDSFSIQLDLRSVSQSTLLLSSKKSSWKIIFWGNRTQA